MKIKEGRNDEKEAGGDELKEDDKERKRKASVPLFDNGEKKGMLIAHTGQERRRTRHPTSPIEPLHGIYPRRV